MITKLANYDDEKVVTGNVVFWGFFFYSLLVIIIQKMNYITSATMCKFKSIGDGTIH